MVGGESIIAPIRGTLIETNAFVRANQGISSPESGWMHEQRYFLRLMSSLYLSAETVATPLVFSLASFSSSSISLFHYLMVESLMIDLIGSAILN